MALGGDINLSIGVPHEHERGSRVTCVDNYVCGSRSGIPRAILVVTLILLQLGHCHAWPMPPDSEPAYVKRGRVVLLQQRAYHAKLERLHHEVSGLIRERAPTLASSVHRPPKDSLGYQILARVVPDGPKPLGARPRVTSFSWGWSEQLISRQIGTIDQLSRRLQEIRRNSHDVAGYRSLVSAYEQLLKTRKAIDADVQYNWLWQASIAADPGQFDRLQSLQTTIVRREALEHALSLPDLSEVNAIAKEQGVSAAPGEELRSRIRNELASLRIESNRAMGPIAVPEFVRIRHDEPAEWSLVVPVYTDIEDQAFVEAAKYAIEKHWCVRTDTVSYKVILHLRHVSVTSLYEAAAAGSPGLRRCPRKGEPIDTLAHSQRFPADGIVLTSGARRILTHERSIVFGPYDVSQNAVAHEFGHLLGFPDSYFRGYRDLGPDGYAVTELADFSDIMGAPGSGPVRSDHFERVLRSAQLSRLMKSGLAALYGGNNPAGAVGTFRKILELDKGHYGATYQLAAALDKCGRVREAQAVWKLVLGMAISCRDEATTRRVQDRLARSLD